MKTCVALHNWLLEKDGLDEPWTIDNSESADVCPRLQNDDSDILMARAAIHARRSADGEEEEEDEEEAESAFWPFLIIFSQ